MQNVCVLMGKMFRLFVCADYFANRVPLHYAYLSP